MRYEFKDILLITNHDWRDSFRSRRVLFLFVLYLAVAILATLLFISIIHSFESKVADKIGLSESKKSGGMTSSFRESKTFEKIVSNMVKDKELTKNIIKIPVLPWFYGWLSFMVSPFLVILLSSESISRSISTGFIRFNMFRTSRLAWAVGKGLSQAVMLFFALLLGAAGVFVIGWLQMSNFDVGPNVWFLLVFTLKGWIYSLPFLGLALAVSQCFRSVNLSLFSGIVSLLLLTALFWIGRYFSGDGIARIWELAIMLTPQDHRLNLILPGIKKNFIACLFLVGLTCTYFLSGFFIFSKRDL